MDTYRGGRSISPHHRNRRAAAAGALAALLCLVGAAAADPIPWPADAAWRDSTLTDPVGDQNPANVDVVGDATYPAVKWYRDDTYLMFRLRINDNPERGGPYSGNQYWFTQYVWSITMEVDGPGVEEPGGGRRDTLDLALSVDGMNSAQQVEIQPRDPTNAVPILPGYTWPAAHWFTDPDTPVGAFPAPPATEPHWARWVVADSTFGGDPDYFIDVGVEKTVLINFIETVLGRPAGSITSFRFSFATSAQNNNVNKDTPEAGVPWWPDDPIPFDATPILTTDPASGSTVDFGPVLVNSAPLSQTITATNTGDDTLTGVVFHGATGGVFGPTTDSAGVDLDPADSTTRDYDYDPTARGADAGTLSVTSTNNGNSDLNLAGTGVAPVSTPVDETGADAGAVLVGMTGTAFISVDNIGDGNLDPRWTSGEGNLHGTAPDGAGTPFSLAGGGTISLPDGTSSGPINYNYTPAQRGTDTWNTNLSFSDGSPDETNSPHTRPFTLTGQAVAPVSSIPDPLDDAGFVLVGNTGTASVDVTNVGDGNLSGLGDPSNLHGTAPGGAGEFTLVSPPDINLTDGSTETMTFEYAPVARGADSEVMSVDFTNGSQDGQNNPHSLSITVQGTGVAPVSSMPDTLGDAGYVLVGDTGTAAVTLTNIGDGNLSGLGAASNLNGTAPDGAGEFTRTSPAALSLADGASADLTYDYAPNTRGADSLDLWATFDNGSPDGENQPHAIGFTVQGSGVAPISDLPGGDLLDYGPVLVGTNSDLDLPVQNIGDGNLSGLGDPSDLHGTAPAGAAPFSLQDPATIDLNDSQTANYTYRYAPTVRSPGDTLALDLSFTNGSPDETNSPHTRPFTLTGEAVAPISSLDDTATDAGIVRVGDTGTASVTVGNVGDGNLSGLGDPSNLHGSVPAGSPPFSLVGSGNFSVPDSGSATFDYTYAPTARGTDALALNADFTDGSQDGTNQAHQLAYVLTGQAVGPVYDSIAPPAATIKFGWIVVSGYADEDFDVGNITTDPDGGDPTNTHLTLHNYTITGPDAALFQMLVDFADGTIVPAGSPWLDLELRFVVPPGTPPGVKTATLTIYTDEGAVFGGAGASFQYTLQGSVVTPEPATLSLLCLGGLAIVWRRRRRTR